MRSPWTWLLSKTGHWEWEHKFKTCPTGDRHCQHMHWKPGQAKAGAAPTLSPPDGKDHS